MAKHTFTALQRWALYFAYEKKCFFTGEPLMLRDLEIDHLVPESLDDDPATLAKVIAAIGLPSDFSVNSYLNWVPTHHTANRQKSNDLLNDPTIRWFLHRSAKNQDRIAKERGRLLQMNKTAKLLGQLAVAIEKGRIEKREALAVVARSAAPVGGTAEDPIILSFGVDADGVADACREYGLDYALSCDRLEAELLGALASRAGLLFTQTEASARNGETLSARCAVWQVDLEALGELGLGRWEILEVDFFSELYGGDAAEFFDQAVVEHYHRTIAGPPGGDDPFGVRMCPSCGSHGLDVSAPFDYRHDEQYFVIKCSRCDWSDWTQ